MNKDGKLETRRSTLIKEKGNRVLLNLVSSITYDL